MSVIEPILETVLGRRDFYAKRIDKDRLFEIFKLVSFCQLRANRLGLDFLGYIVRDRYVPVRNKVVKSYKFKKLHISINTKKERKMDKKR
ncbi:hypothetical protein [Campylobacter concisus]